jgi:hypothetical protein
MRTNRGKTKIKRMRRGSVGELGVAVTLPIPINDLAALKARAASASVPNGHLITYGDYVRQAVKDFLTTAYSPSGATALQCDEG